LLNASVVSSAAKKREPAHESRKNSFGNCRVSANVYDTQLKKIDKAMDKVHPDLQFDFNQQIAGR